MKTPSSIVVFLCNLLWFISTIPDALRFAWALRHPETAQKRVAQRIKDTEGQPVIKSLPTSGSTGPTKWIPYTQEFIREFQSAVNPWIFSVFFRHPSLFFSTHYWSITPMTKPQPSASGAEVSASDDSDYLPPLQRWISHVLFTVTPFMDGVTTPEQYARQTTLGLLAAKHLGLISIWHPSALLRLLDYATANADALSASLVEIAGRRRSEQVSLLLKKRDFQALWPSLAVISCWDNAFAAADAERLRTIFPKVEVEGKGLTATEGIITFPWFGKCVAAVTSHELRIREVDVDDLPTSDPIPIHKAEPEKRYTIYITSANGQRDYQLNDIIQCTGFLHSTPVFTFLHRAGGVSDLHGEKLHPGPVQDAIDSLSKLCGGFSTAFLMPRQDRLGYDFVCTPSSGARPPSSEEVEHELGKNYYYRHTRNLGQLQPVNVIASEDALAFYCKIKNTPVTVAKPQPILITNH